MKLLAKSLGAALAVAATLAATGAAASLAFTSDRLAAGNATVTSCGVASLSATRNVDNAGNVTQVNIPSVPAACAGETLSVTLAGAGNASVGSASAVVPAGGGTMSFSSLGATVSAASVLGYRYAVVGP
jgi:autotransporter translocation and assembly factor TamB